MKRFFGLLVAVLVLTGLVAACGDTSPTTMPAALSTPAATATPAPPPLPEAWYTLPPDAYKNPNFSGPYGTLLKQLAENSTRYSSVRITLEAKSDPDNVMMLDNATIVVPKKGVVWWDFNVMMKSPNISGRMVAVNDTCYSQENGAEWQKESPIAVSKCKDEPLGHILEIHPVITILFGAPDSPRVAPEKMPVLDIKALPDEVYEGKPVGVLLINGTTTWRYDKTTYRLVQMKDSQEGGPGVTFRFDNYDDPNLKIVAPIP
ncbi:MAG TPA: hypothetical protein VH186_36605 [Chloroflexia bacterium]|nr:hypothetical protein [Chloroflexia bacterium]